MLVANLDPALARRAPAEDVGEVLAAFPDGLTTAEVAAVMAFVRGRPGLLRQFAEATSGDRIGGTS